MPLADLQLEIEAAALPAEVRTFLREAERRIERFSQDAHLPAFVPSDYPLTYGALHALVADNVAPGDLFCEWGSGFGVVACLAAMLGFNACGIEIEEELVEQAQRLADDFDLPVQFLRGSFVPKGTDVSLDTKDGFDWLSTEEADTEEAFGLAPADFDVIFAYPWPDEEQVIEALFKRHAAVGAVLLTYTGGDALRVQRKTGRKW
jgi:hypothetical protein